MDLFEMGLWILSLIVSFALGWFTNWHFYQKQRKESKADAEILKQIRQYVGAQIRLGHDKRGKIIENPRGTIGIAWQVNIPETSGISANADAQKMEGEQK